MHRFILLLISAHDKQAGRLAGRAELIDDDGAGLHKNGSCTHTCFPCPMCTWCQQPAFVRVHHANPVSLINARPRNERLIFFFMCAAQHSTPYAHHRPSSPARVQDHGPERLSMVQCRGRDRHVAHPKKNSTSGYAVPSTTITILPVRDAQLGTHAKYPQGCPKLVYGKGWALPLRRAVRIRTRALQAQIIWIRLWARMSFRFWKEWGPTDHRSGPGVGQPKLQAPAGQGGIVPAHGELSRDSPPRRDGLFLSERRRRKSLPVIQSPPAASQGGRDRHAGSL